MINPNAQLEEKYIKTKHKRRKIVTYKKGDNSLRRKHEQIAHYLNLHCTNSIFAKAYAPNSSIIKNAKAHMYNDIFMFFDVKDFFPTINHNYLIQRLFHDLRNSDEAVDLHSCNTLIELCSVSKKGLPLGLVTSPVLSNIYMKEFDNILYGKLKKLELSNVIYTRYADDIVISFKSTDCPNDYAQSVKEIVCNCLKQVHLKSNYQKERVYYIKMSGHVRITGINITCAENNYRSLTVGRKRKRALYQDTLKYFFSKRFNRAEALRLKGTEAFILSVEGNEYEKCYSDSMRQIIMQQGFNSLHDMINSFQV